MTCPNGVMYMVNSTGPNTEPWGTPYFNTVGWDALPPANTVWLRSVKYDSSHRSTTSDMPKVSLTLFSSILWPSVSNAADRSRSDRMETDPWSQAMSRSFVTLNNRVWVLWSALYADWNGSSVSVAFRWSDSCWRTTFSRIFERKCRLKTGRWFLSTFLTKLGFYLEGKHNSLLEGWGTIPDTRDSLMMAVMVGIKSSRHSCTRHVGTGLSMHGFFGGFKDDVLHLLLCHKGEGFKSGTTEVREVRLSRRSIKLVP